MYTHKKILLPVKCDSGLSSETSGGFCTSRLLSRSLIRVWGGLSVLFRGSKLCVSPLDVFPKFNVNIVNLWEAVLQPSPCCIYYVGLYILGRDHFCCHYELWFLAIKLLKDNFKCELAGPKQFLLSGLCWVISDILKLLCACLYTQSIWSFGFLPCLSRVCGSWWHVVYKVLWDSFMKLGIILKARGLAVHLLDNKRNFKQM